jgi:hypothetical protein
MLLANTNLCKGIKVISSPSFYPINLKWFISVLKCLVSRISTILSFLILILPIGTTNSQVPEEGSPVYIISKVRSEKEGIDLEIAKAKGEVNSFAAAMQKAIEERNQIDKQARNLIDSDESVRLRQQAVSYKTSCDGVKLYGQAIEQCKREFDLINPRLEKLQLDIDRLKAQFDEKSRIATENSNSKVLAEARIRKLMNYQSWLVSAEARMLSLILNMCTKAEGFTSLEDLKTRCGNVQFDGAMQDALRLPLCESEVCQRGTRFFKKSN